MRANTNNHQNLAQKTANFLPYRVVVLGVSVSTCIKIQRFFRSNFSRTYNVNKLVDVRLCWSDITKFVYIVSPSEIWLEEPLKIQKWTKRISENKDSSNKITHHRKISKKKKKKKTVVNLHESWQILFFAVLQDTSL